jgi:hypothetical protein
MTTQLAPISPARAALFLTRNQFSWLALQVAALVGMLLWQLVGQTEGMKLLFNDPTGIKLTVSAVLLLLLNFAILTGAYYGLNRFMSPEDQDRALLQRTMSILVAGGCFVLFYLPACFVLLIGPAVLSIRSTMMAP